MDSIILHDAVALLEKANANLEPELMAADAARALLAEYARVEKLAAFGKAVIARKIDDTTEIARATGTSIGKAKQTVETGKALRDADDVRAAFADGAISLDQATEIARAKQARPGVGAKVVGGRRDRGVSRAKDKARKIKLEAEEGGDLLARQHAARSARTYNDEFGMVHIHLALEPHFGAAIVNRAEAEGACLYRKAKGDGAHEPDRCRCVLSGVSTTEQISDTFAGGPATPRSRSESPCSSVHPPISTGSDVSTAATASGTKTTTSNPILRTVPRRPAT